MIWSIMLCIAAAIVSFNIMNHFGFVVWLIATAICWLFIAAIKLVMKYGETK